MIDGETGFLVPPLKPGRLADPLQRRVDDPALRERMGAAGQGRTDDHYSVERYLDEVRAMYLELVERG